MSSESHGGNSGFQVTGMIEWVQKIKTQKNLCTKNQPPPPKISWWISEPENFPENKTGLVVLYLQNYCTWGTWALPLIFRLFLILPINPYLNQANQKIPAKFFYPRKIVESKISNQSLEILITAIPWVVNKSAREIFSCFTIRVHRNSVLWLAIRASSS